MISLATIVIFLLIHWFNDFFCQSSWMALNKSTNNWALFAHTATYSSLWFIPSILFLGPAMGLLFTIITFIAHTATDFITSRLTKVEFGKGTDEGTHNGFVIVGIDQVLHYIQLFLTYLILS